MTRTIQDLKDENQLLRDGIRTIAAGLNSGEYGSMTSIDPDLAVLHVSVGHLVTEHGHAVRQREMANQAMEAWVERCEKEIQRANELAAIIRRAQMLADEDRVDGSVYGEDSGSTAGPGWKSAMGRDLHAVLKKGMQALVDHYDGIHKRAWDNGHMVGCEETISKHMRQENAVRAKHWRDAIEWISTEDGFGYAGTADRAYDMADAIERGES